MLQLCNQKLKWEIEYNLYIRDANKDGNEELYAFGGRSFTIWNGDSGSLVLIVKMI
jgi:hypothetical protein